MEMTPEDKAQLIMYANAREYLIWWTNQSDVERIEHLGLDGQLGHWPKYIFDQFASRNGRNGRGRLWIDSSLTKPGMPQEVENWTEKNPVCRMAQDAGGIVILATDVGEVAHLPGFVTDFDMKIRRT